MIRCLLQSSVVRVAIPDLQDDHAVTCQLSSRHRGRKRPIRNEFASVVKAVGLEDQGVARALNVVNGFDQPTDPFISAHVLPMVDGRIAKFYGRELWIGIPELLTAA